MNIEEFWNSAYIAALTRLPARDARREADLATELCIEHWRSHRRHWEPGYSTMWKDQDVTSALPSQPPGQTLPDNL
ncbi:hypothetical protein Q0S19_05970 [Stenotrophomonas indicatrix]|jgi:hypothetical protein|uniref:hypothetical protein n=1 Tax=Stenotrophomonas indicatrix TaxID=2045451 RepID=UPI0026528164|nr:hypothetical protein [Stenotrophomonas indicatrix]MDN8644016.1 hypothetical protein [Stenotrophomonas indicatrix]